MYSRFHAIILKTSLGAVSVNACVGSISPGDNIFCLLEIYVKNDQKRGQKAFSNQKGLKTNLWQKAEKTFLLFGSTCQIGRYRFLTISGEVLKLWREIDYTGNQRFLDSPLQAAISCLYRII